MKYTLTNREGADIPAGGLGPAFRSLWPMMAEDKARLLRALLLIVLSSGPTILAPLLVSRAIDGHLAKGDYRGVVAYCVALFTVYVASSVASYAQTRIMGRVGQGILFRLRNALFMKLGDLPLGFFGQNKAGDLISRINNDTDKLNQFFSRSLMQFVGNVFVVIGAAIAMLAVSPRLGAASLLPALALLVLTRLTSTWIKRRNFSSLQAMGGLSAEIQESLDNFKVIIAFNRRDFFRARFAEANGKNYAAALRAGIANNTYVPIYGFASQLGQLIVITYGLTLIAGGSLSFGVLVGFLAYVSRFYDPLRQMASIWADLQTALAGWERISEILAMESDLLVVPSGTKSGSGALLEFRAVGFSYPGGTPVLQDVSFKMEAGKTYALVGPTGGGKTTTASLIARLYDPTGGTVFLQGKDIRSYAAAERAAKIGFILQEPFLFGGDVRENIAYGSEELMGLSAGQFEECLEGHGLRGLLARFEQGAATPVTAGGETISLGQKQLIAFMRAVLRRPDLLILDEATANVDTVTERLLEDVLAALPPSTTRVIIAHRLNTIENADEIFFVNGGRVTPAGSMGRAVEMLGHGARKS